MRGPKNTEFEGGVYHGKIILPADYPLKPPDIIFLTPNGRFDVGKKICLTISSHHAETWFPSWSVRTVILAIIGFFPTRGDGAIASLDWSRAERVKLAQSSLGWKCNKCGTYNITALPAEHENNTFDQISEIVDIKIKNKEEQERDEAEKKRQEEAKGTQLSSQQPDPSVGPPLLPLPPEDQPSQELPPHLQPQPQSPQLAVQQPPLVDLSESSVRHRSGTSPAAGVEQHRFILPLSHPQRRGVIRTLDIFIVIIFFIVAGLVGRKIL